MFIELDRDNYEAETLRATGTVLVDFWGEQCRPCVALMPAVEKLASDYAGKLKVAKVNAPKNRMLCARLRVLGLPTFILYRDGDEKARLVGEQTTARDLKAAVESVLS